MSVNLEFNKTPTPSKREGERGRERESQREKERGKERAASWI